MTEITKYLLDLTPWNWTPLIKSMEECLEQDVKSTGRTADDVTMLVLTDGADSSQGLISELVKQKNEQEIARIVKVNSDQVKKIFEQESISIRIVYFNENTTASDDAEWKVAEKQFAGLSGFKVPGEIRRVTDPRDLIEELNKSLMPKIQLHEKSSGALVETRYQNYFPAPRLVDPRPIDLKFFPESGRLAGGDYEASVWIGRKQPISFSRGDHLYIRLENGGGNQVRYSRDLFADVWKRQVSEPRQFEKKGDWHLTIAETRPVYDSGLSRGHLTVTLENERNKMVDNQTPLKQYKPGFVWWDVKSIDDQTNQEKTPSGTVHVANRGYYLAPAWDVDKSPNDEREVQLSAWAGDSRPEVSEAYRFRGGDLQKPINARIGSLPLVLSLERHALIDACVTRAPREELCLVLRVRHDAGSRYLFNIQGLPARRVDHHYFDQAQSTTVYFSPISEEILGDRQKEYVVEMRDVGKWLADRKPTIAIKAPMDKQWEGPTLPSRGNAPR